MSLATPHAVIVLATYQGAAWIGAQLQSLVEQTCPDWRLIARDDGSTDGTADVLAQFAQSDSRIEVVHDTLGRLGPVGNFANLLNVARNTAADYVLCADQDDVWRPDKLSRQLAAAQAALAEWGADVPLLVHSDLEVVDERLRMIQASLMASSGLDPRPECPLRALLPQNFVTGCALLANRALLEIALPVPDQAALHDWWLALCAAACGRIVYLPEPLVRYRQHPGNQVGAAGSATLLGRFLRQPRQRFARHARNFRQGIAQARALQQRIDERSLVIPPRERDLLASYASLFDPAIPRMQRWAGVRRLGIRPTGSLKNLAYYSQLWCQSSRGL